MLLRLLPLIVATLAVAAEPPKPPQPPPQPRDALADVRSVLADRDYPAALRLLDAHLAAKDAPADETLYLKGNTLALAKRHTDAVDVLERLLREHPKSDWRRKAVFKIADCRLGQTPPDYAKAAAILEREVTALTGPERKAEIAAIYLKFADEAFAPTAKDATGRPLPPRYPEAKRFYELAVEVGLSADEAKRVDFRLAVCEQRSEQNAEAVARVKAFLKRHADDAGFAPEAGYLLGEAHLAAGQPVEARSAWRDMAGHAGKLRAKAAAQRADEIAGLAALALYRVGETYDRTAKDGYPAYVRALQAFIDAFPKHALVPQARFDMALAAFNLGRHEDSAASFTRFLADHEKLGDVEYVATERLIAVQHGRPDAAPANRRFLTPSARHLLGRSLAAQKRYAEAVEVWQTFLARHSGDSLWTQVQQAIVDTEYAVGQDRLDAKDPAAARLAWEKFIAKHPLDGRVPGLYFAFGQINFDEKKYAEALADWRLLVGKFPGTEEAGRAQYRIGLTLEIQLDKPADALEEFRKLTWSEWAGRARQRMSLMTQRELTVATERSVRSNETPVVKLYCRNIAKVQVRVYNLDLASFFHKQHTILGVEYLDLALISPTKRFEHTVRGFAQYRPNEDTIEIPLDGPGVAAVTVGDDKLQATTLIVRSDLDILIKAGRDETFVFAQNMRTGEPFAGVDVLVSDGREVRSAGVTAADGVLRIKDKKLAASATTVAVFAAAEGHVAANAVSLQGLRAAEGLAAKGVLYTDRPAYRPGQTVSVRGIIREVKDGSYSFSPGDLWTCDISDPEGRVLRSDRLRLSDFGSLHTRFLLDEFAPLGDYRIVVRKDNGPTFAGGFAVARYQLPKLQLKFDLPETVYFRGETVKGRITARYYYGEPAADKTISYSLGGGQILTAKTDAKGEVAFEIDTKQFSETQTVPLSATVAEENITVHDALVISTQGFGITLSTIRDVYLTEENFDLSATTLDAKGKPIGEKLKVTLLRREAHGPRTVGVGGVGSAGTSGEVAVMSRDLTTDAKTGKGTVSLSAEKGGWHVIRVEGTDRFGNTISRDKPVFLSGDDDQTKIRIVSDTQTFKVGDRPSVHIHSRLDRRLALVTYEGEGVIAYELLRLLPGMNVVRPSVDHRFFPNFSMGVAVMEPKRLHQARFEFNVERELKITLKPDRTTLQPGQPLDVQLTVTDQAGKPVSAELAVSLVDAALIAMYGDPGGAMQAVFGGGRRQSHTRVASSVLFAYSPATMPVSPLVPGGAEPDNRKVVAAQVENLKRELRRQVAEVRGRGDAQRLAVLANSFNQTKAVLDNEGEGRAVNPNAANWYLSLEVPQNLDQAALNSLASAGDTTVEVGKNLTQNNTLQRDSNGNVTTAALFDNRDADADGSNRNIEEAVDFDNLVRDQTRTEFQRRLSEARTALQLGDLDKADVALNGGVMVLQSNGLYLNTSGGELFAEAEAVRSDIRLGRAGGPQNGKLSVADEKKALRVSGLLRNAENALRGGDAARALENYDLALRMDPGNVAANARKSVVGDMYAFQVARGIDQTGKRQETLNFYDNSTDGQANWGAMTNRSYTPGKVTVTNGRTGTLKLRVLNDLSSAHESDSADRPAGGPPRDGKRPDDAEKLHKDRSGFVFQGGERPGDREDAPFVDKFRDYFPETGYWNPAVVTDKDGKAKLQITLPDSITRWRLQARGVTADTVVGDADTEITVRKDFFVELRAPVILHTGDKVAVSARVHHLAELKPGQKERSVKLTLVVQQGRDRREETKTVVFAGKDIREVVFAPQSAAGVETALTVVAVSDDGLKDTVVRTVPVRPEGVRFVAHDAATTRNSAVSIFGLPSGRTYGQMRMNIVVGPSLARSLIDTALNVQPRLVNTKRPIGGPGGEGRGEEWVRIPSDGPSSAAGDLLAVTFTLSYLKTTGLGGGPEQAELDGRMAQLTAGLTVAQNGDGGWSWCGGNQPSEPFIAARVMWALAAAKEAGYPVNATVLERSANYLLAEFTRAAESDHQTKAVLLHALSESSTGDWFTPANRLYRSRNALATATLAHLSLTFSNLGRKEMAAEINGLLSARRRVVTDLTGPARSFWTAAGSHSWLSADVEVTALALLALQRVNPRDEAVEPGVRWLTAQRQGLRVRPDKATGLVVASLGRYHAATKPSRERYRLAVVVNGHEVGRADVDAGSRSLQFEVPPEMLAPGRNKVEFQLEGDAEYSYAVTLSGWGQGEDVDLSAGRLSVTRRFEPAQLEHDGRTVPRGFTTLSGTVTPWNNPLTQLPAGKTALVTLLPSRNVRDDAPSDLDYVVLHEPLPAGCGVSPDSVRGGFDRFEIGDGEITFFLGRRHPLTPIHYTLVGMSAGEFKAPAPVMSSAYRPGVMRVGTGRLLTVLPREGKSTDPYRMTPDELYHLGRTLFEEGKSAAARGHLSQLFDGFNTPQTSLKDEVYREAARMLLRAAIEAKDNDAIVRFFEVLRERYPDLVIPYQQVLTIGRAYLAKGEFERGLIVFRATADAGFVTEAQVAQVLQNQGRFDASVDFLRTLLLQYPDTASTQSSLFALSQLVYSAAANLEKFADLKERKATKPELVGRAVRLIREFLSLHPTHPAADEAGFSMAAALLELEDYAGAAGLAEALQRRHPDSPLTDQFLYIRAFAAYAQGDFVRALADSRRVAEGKFRSRAGVERFSDNRWLAAYIIGQIHHSRRDPAAAIAAYEKVADRYPDAKEAIEHFTRKDLSIDEVKTFVPAKPPAKLPDGADIAACETMAKTVPHVRLAFRNVPEAQVKVYKVDLLKLYLLRGNLSGITGVNLTGITPTFVGQVKLGDGKDYAEKARYFWLPQTAETPGAYLVVVRAENLHRSGLVLVSGLKMDVNEDDASGRVRVNIKRTDGAYAPKVHVQAIAEGNPRPESGDTDLRGLFIADDLKGRVTVLAQAEGEHYAFHRGTTSLQGFAVARLPSAANPSNPNRNPSLRPGDYLENVNRFNTGNVERNKAVIEKDVFNNDKGGVQVKQAQ